MVLKEYQKKVLRNLSLYLKCVGKEHDYVKVWKDYWHKQDIPVGVEGVPNYNGAISLVPHICMKVPTGGGKTFIACAALKKIFAAMPLGKSRVVVWLVPSDPILQQTIKNLSNVNHPYRQWLDKDFAGRVGIYTKDMLLSGQNFSPDTVREMLSICVLSYASLRIDDRKKEGRKAYQENGNLLRFAEYYKDDESLLEGTPNTALIQILRHLSPVTIVDESHNAGSELSVEMLNNLNPSLVLDLTATPRQNSNIISYVDARELKKENMVKLPVIVYNRTNRQSVIQDAIQLRCCIEKQAIAEETSGGKYIRPIVLFQAQSKNNENSETFDKIKKLLTDAGIPENEIAIKTSKIDELKNIDLMSKECTVRYIITVDALREGWDCSFAYILASLANRTSTIAVEQILGRVLRQPYAMQHAVSLLNTSFVLTSSDDFHATLENIVIGLNKAGFSEKDFRVGEVLEPPKEISKEDGSLQIVPSVFAEEENFDDIAAEEVKVAITKEPIGAEETELDKMLQEAEQKTAEYTKALSETDDAEFMGSELGDMINKKRIKSQFVEEIKELHIPQFFLKNAPDLFGGEFAFLEKENLSEGFSLAGQDADISFELATGEMYSIDLQEEGDAVPQYKRASKDVNSYIRDYLATIPSENKLNQCAEIIVKNLNKNDRYATSELKEYVHRIIQNMTDDEVNAMETAIPSYALKIQKKIEQLEVVYREKMFSQWLDSGKIVCKDKYELPEIITPETTTTSIPKSLYEAEKDDMNNYEDRLIDVIASYDNVKWWHRIIERKGFKLNGFITHYPDFMVMTNSGNILLIEGKGDDRDNEDSKKKLKLGRMWQAQAGEKYRYFMVFENKDMCLEGAYTLDKFAEVLKNL